MFLVGMHLMNGRTSDMGKSRSNKSYLDDKTFEYKKEDHCPICWCPYFICPECDWEICGCEHLDYDCSRNILYDLALEDVGEDDN